MLLDTLRGKGLEENTLRWLANYLDGRTALLKFDGATTGPYNTTAGVPQGSPLSPILFILFASTLYDKLRASGLIVIGFADDTNLVAFGRDRQTCIRVLETAYATATAWATERGMEFEPTKSTLVHFERGGPGDATPVTLTGTTVQPSKDSRFLGI